ncbi:MAG: fibronectin type III domain-containing protein [Gammaproteobacteria bacterium]|nr:fibronectin type III domain-containing protein [Gammaproteobacteria bacterium]MDH5651803.1 fibronectin type III domain-containing protein [Gammaproteobacteria bacterium]
MLTTDTTLATAGYYRLSWQPGLAGALNKNIRFELQEASHRQFHQFKIIYRGPDHASVISGKADGNYFYRVRSTYADAAPGGWSQPILVEVKHHAMHRAWWFFSAGAVVFLFILLFILTASRKIRAD